MAKKNEGEEREATTAKRKGAKQARKAKTVTGKEKAIVKAKDKGAAARLLEEIDAKGVGDNETKIKDIVKHHLTTLMNKGGSDGARVSAARSLMEVLYKEKEKLGGDDDGDENCDRQSAIDECARILAELTARLAARPARKAALA